MRTVIVTFIVAAALLAMPAAQAADASWAWDQVAPGYGFETTGQAAITDTFADAYHGTPETILQNFDAALRATAQLMASGQAFIDLDDNLDKEIEHWLE